jgi:hypothetical protein
MNKTRLTLNALSVVILTLMVTSFAQAQATRTWVSGVGDDVNPCSRTAPCKTFAGAISKTADGGEIDALDPGGYGTLTITKGITVDGAGTNASVLAALAPQGFLINETTNTKDIRIRNISINGAGSGTHGIRILTGKTIHIENVEIAGFTGNGVDAPLSSVAAISTKLYMYNVNISRLTGASSIGVRLSAPTAYFGVMMDRVNIARAPTGVQVGSQVFPTIRDSIIVGSTTGVEMVNNAAGSPLATIENTMLTDNSTGIAAGAGTRIALSQTTITDCSVGISNGGGVVQSSGNNRILGNSNDGVVPTIINPK